MHKPLRKERISIPCRSSSGPPLLQTAPNLRKKRNKLVRMTEAGRAYCEKVVRHITWAEDTAMSMFTAEEQKKLIDLSRTFTKNLTMLINQETEE